MLTLQSWSLRHIAKPFTEVGVGRGSDRACSTRWPGRSTRRPQRDLERRTCDTGDSPSNQHFQPNNANTVTGYATKYNETNAQVLHDLAHAFQTSCQNPPYADMDPNGPGGQIVIDSVIGSRRNPFVGGLQDTAVQASSLRANLTVTLSEGLKSAVFSGA